MHLDTSEIKAELFKETFLLAIYFQRMAWLDLSFRNFTAAHILVPYSLSIFIVIDCIKVSYSAREGFCSFVSWFKTITLQNQDSFWCGNISGKLQSSLYYTVCLNSQDLSLLPTITFRKWLFSYGFCKRNNSIKAVVFTQIETEA